MFFKGLQDMGLPDINPGLQMRVYSATITIDTQCDFLYTPTPKKEILINSNLLTTVPPDLFCVDITAL